MADSPALSTAEVHAKYFHQPLLCKHSDFLSASGVRPWKAMSSTYRPVLRRHSGVSALYSHSRSLAQGCCVLGYPGGSSKWARQAINCKAEGKPPSMGEASPLETNLSWRCAQIVSQPYVRGVPVKSTHVHGEGNACS